MRPTSITCAAAFSLLTVIACRDAPDAGADAAREAAPDAAPPITGRDPPPRRPPPDAPTGVATSQPMIAVCPGGTASRVDRDGDGISDLVEASNRALGREELDPLRCDPDPSRAVGRPYKGKLAKGVNLPDTGTGFKHFLGTDAKDSDDWGTLAMVQCFEAVGQGMNAMGREVGITDLSSIDGGRFVPHKSHQTGIDADVRYLRTDKKNWPLDLKRYPDLYDEAATLAMFKLFAKHCAVDVVFVDTHRIGFSQDDVPELRLAHAGGHSNHFHVRLNLGGE